MPDEKRDLFRYTNYFTKTAPQPNVQVLALLALGAITGALSAIIINHADFLTNITALIVYGASSGLLVISLPALLTAAMIKGAKRRIQLKHLLFATIFISLFYSLFIIMGSALFAIFSSNSIAYIIILLGNAGIYGYWLVIGKFLIQQRRGGNIIAALQPTLNILFYIPLGKYILNLGLPISIALIKLYAGMLIFLVVGYIFLYMVDKPLKEAANVSGISVFTMMVNQWLYDFVPDDGQNLSFGVKRDITTDMLLLKDRKGKYKAIFVKPDIHYGPFGGVGGGIATEYLGDYLHNKYGATAFVLHGPVNIANNPVSSSQIYKLSKSVASYVDSLKPSDFSSARGSLHLGSSGPCRAISLMVNDLRMLILSKAPMVTEDIDYEIGQSFKHLALKHSRNAIVIDAHNSRSESASEEELRGVYYGSKYAQMYASAIKETMKGNGEGRLRFGSAQQKIGALLNNPKDIGKGYSSFCIFVAGKKKFGIIYFDSNNMLPRLREEIISHVAKKFRIQVEVCTTDTHGVNSLALPSSNVLGRETQIGKLLPIVDAMISVALNGIEDVQVHSGNFVTKGFRVWGENAERDITMASKEVIRTVKHVAPFVIVLGFIIAAWIIYAA
ncbi:MAG: DUF2070 family protein [Candidatus Micrarchaeota archaeon]|nr:DUF2070 family protein [Candidatus Micrarchaeota archaeon]MDE1847861.1 DUF2070 family protein [Candidatus Micrarchaeota archaeon]MDE1864188.1 DUF2070 family protein [Candidatus Micrarchaeota archaeon]